MRRIVSKRDASEYFAGSKRRVFWQKPFEDADSHERVFLRGKRG
jgi:hypothetical protein